MEFLAGLSILFGFVVTIFWLVIGWRAMTAHERIGDAAAEWMYQQRAERIAKQQAERPNPPVYKRFGSQRREEE